MQGIRATLKNNNNINYLDYNKEYTNTKQEEILKNNNSTNNYVFSNNFEEDDLNNNQENKSSAIEYRNKNNNIQKEAKALVQKAKLLINNQTENIKKSNYKIKTNANTTTEYKTRSPANNLYYYHCNKKEPNFKNYEEPVRIKSRSPSPNNETRYIKEKFNNSLILSEANLKSILKLIIN